MACQSLLRQYGSLHETLASYDLSRVDKLHQDWEESQKDAEEMLVHQRDTISKQLLQAIQGISDDKADEHHTVNAQAAQMMATFFGSGCFDGNIAQTTQNMERSVNKMVKDLPIDAVLP